MKETKTTKKINFSVKARLLLISNLPVIIVGIAILIIAIFFIKSGMEKETLKGLLASAYTYRDTGILNMDREKGDNAIENELKEYTGYDFTWFEGDTRKNSSLGEDVIGKKAVDTVITQVINNNQPFTSTKTDVAGEDYFVAYVPVIGSNGEVIGMAFTGVSRYSVESQITKSIISMLLIVTFFLLITFLIALRASFAMSGGIKAIEESVTKLANGEFVKSVKYLKRSDEIGKTLNSTNNLVDTFKNIATDMNNASQLISLKASELAETSNNINIITNDVSQAAFQVAAGATEQTTNIQNASSNIANLSDAIQNVANHSEQLAIMAAEMDESGHSSSDALKNLFKEMGELMQSVESITKTMSNMNHAVQMVNSKVGDIANIASQTNLLALNASIEAARAGDAGKGFSVVADETGKLAVASANTAQEIQVEMKNLLSQSNDALTKTDDISLICQKVSDVLQDTYGKINDLIDNVQLTVNGVTTISALTEECEASKFVIVDAMDSLSAISEQNAAATEETSAAMHEVSSFVSSLATTSSELEKLAKDLDKDLSFFKI